MKKRNLLTSILLFLAPLTLAAQSTGDPFPPLTCADQNCHHSERTQTTVGEFEWFQVKSRGQVEPLFAVYNPALDRVAVKWPNPYHIKVYDLDEFWESWNVFSEGEAHTNGTSRDMLTVGRFAIRKKAPYGDVFTKGWFGSDEYDDLLLTLPKVSARYESENRWNGGALHHGEANLRQELSSHTMLKPIGGSWFFGNYGYAGSIQPQLRNDQVITGIGEMQEGFGEIKYNHEEDSVVMVSLKATGGVSGGKDTGASAGVEVGMSGEYASTNPHVTASAMALANARGDAENPARMRFDHSFQLTVFTNDMISAWNIGIQTVEEPRMSIWTKLQVPATKIMPVPSAEKSMPVPPAHLFPVRPYSGEGY